MRALGGSPLSLVAITCLAFSLTSHWCMAFTMARLPQLHRTGQAVAPGRRSKVVQAISIGVGGTNSTVAGASDDHQDSAKRSRRRKGGADEAVNRTRVEIGLFGRTAFKGEIPETSMEPFLKAVIDLEKQELARQFEKTEAPLGSSTEAPQVEALTKTVVLLSNELSKEREARVLAEMQLERIRSRLLREANTDFMLEGMEDTVRDMQWRLEMLEQRNEQEGRMDAGRREPEATAVHSEVDRSTSSPAEGPGPQNTHSVEEEGLDSGEDGHPLERQEAMVVEGMEGEDLGSQRDEQDNSLQEQLTHSKGGGRELEREKEEEGRRGVETSSLPSMEMSASGSGHRRDYSLQDFVPMGPSKGEALPPDARTIGDKPYKPMEFKGFGPPPVRARKASLAAEEVQKNKKSHPHTIVFPDRTKFKTQG